MQVIVEGKERAVMCAGEESKIFSGREINRMSRIKFWSISYPVAVIRQAYMGTKKCM